MAAIRTLTYHDFDLRVAPLDGGYRAQVTRSDAGEGQSAFFGLPFAPNEFGAVRRAPMLPSRAAAPGDLTLQAIGERLFSAAFAGKVGECLARSRERAAANAPSHPAAACEFGCT